MKKVLFLSALILISYLIVPSCNQKNEKQTHEDDQGYLFDGANADHWRAFKSDSLPANWVVQNGNLVTLGHGGDLGGDIITKETYEDFDLSLEWAISEGGNSGIFFHVLEYDHPTVYATGPEYQLIDDIGFPHELEEWQKTGANYAMHNADTAKKKLNPIGEFNSSRIRVDDGHVTHWLNDEKVLEYELWTDEWKELVQNSKWKDYPSYGLVRRGHIALQDHGSVVKFRNIKIKDLTNKGKPLFNGKDLQGWRIHGTEKWYVKNGELVCESGPDKQYGYLATDSLYDDFILRLKFKQESDGNSGVFFRSVLDGTNIKGWQVEVAPRGKDSGGIYESAGRGWLHQIPDEKEGILKPGEWNDMTIKVEGERVMVWLNNEMMTDLEDEKIGEGKGVIALQIHSGEDVKIRWKNIYLKEID